MTEILLNAVINLFAALAALLDDDSRDTVRTTLKGYLRDHLRLGNVTEYMGLYDLMLEMHAANNRDALTAQASGIAKQLRTRLPLLEQYVFMLRYVQTAAHVQDGSPARRLVTEVAAALSVGDAEVDALRTLCRLSRDGAAQGAESSPCRIIERPGVEGALAALRLEDAAATLVAALPGAALQLDSHPLHPGSPQLLGPGSIIRDARGNRIYQADVDAQLSGRDATLALTVEAQNLDFRYPQSDNGLHDFSFSLTGGMLVGVMGVSGAGKSTLLSILNGQQRPDSGSLLINGVDLHAEPEQLEGVIGYVPQDDLLFEELSVFDNLHSNARLCMAHLDEAESRRRVDALLDELDQLTIRDLKVGSPLEKTISGGQRKRLNIALELLREPSILFVDEPTSGLSSSDSENVMALLKAQAEKGKLVIVVIHQPSSVIYKMFDRLWIMDRGGRPIFDGNPLDAIVHFRSEVFRAGMDEYACPRCGQVNPEQLFEIIETRTIDDEGRYTRERLVAPEHWHRRYLEDRAKQPPEPSPTPSVKVERRLWRPGWIGQLGVFFHRTFKGRMQNRQYLAINLLEPPVLALLAALISHGAWGTEYSFMGNENLTTYFFISVIVALFLGLSVSAEEINRDRKILRREQFLNLSWSSYATSKALYLFGMSAVQMALYTLVGNAVLEIPGMFWPTFGVLFSCAAASAVLGLNISASFRSAVTIYILIPLLLVPQMMLGGAVIPYDDLLHRQAGHNRTPLVADVMPSRWGYEALVVHQFLTNDYSRRFLPWTLERKQYDYLAGYHVPEIRALADYPLTEDNLSARPEETRRRLAALRNELDYVAGLSGLDHGISAAALTVPTYGSETRKTVKRYLRTVEKRFRFLANDAFDRIRDRESALRNELGRDGLAELKRCNYNKDVATQVFNTRTLEYVRLSGAHLVQVATPVSRPPDSPFGGAQFMAASKRVGSAAVPTFTYNLAVLWCMALGLFLALLTRLLPRVFRAGESLFTLPGRRRAATASDTKASQ